jgi:hypothetical protein
MVQPTLKSFFEGYNTTVIAYGQTGSGKTYTMGTGSSIGMEPKAKGIVHRVVEDLFSHATSSDMNVTVKVSFLEIYNEELRDLLVR